MTVMLRLPLRLISAALISLSVFTSLSSTAASQILTEKVEWTWADRPEHPDPVLPNVLLIGDSITCAYYAETSDLLDGRANCYLFATSASSGDPRLPDQIADLARIIPSAFAVIHFNNGMHGWAYTEQQYAAGLPSLIASVRKLSPSAAFIWATTTPVRKPATAGATNERVDTRNHLALEIMQQQHILIDDQNALMLQHQDLHQDDVHFTPAGSTLQAQQVAQTILKRLPTPK